MSHTKFFGSTIEPVSLLAVEAHHHAFKENARAGRLVAVLRSSRVSTGLQVIKPCARQKHNQTVLGHSSCFVYPLSSWGPCIFHIDCWQPCLGPRSSRVGRGPCPQLQLKRPGDRSTPAFSHSYWGSKSQPHSSVAALDKNKALDPAYQWGLLSNVSVITFGDCGILEVSCSHW